MNIAILGLGHVGSVAAGCLAEQGHRVVGVDTNPAKVEAINQGRSPVVEPGLDQLIGQARSKGLLRASTMVEQYLSGCDIALVCVGTPTTAPGEHDLRHIISATESIARAVSPQRNSSLTVAYRSTVQPGTCSDVIAPIFRQHLGEAANDRIEIVHHPEFLREGCAIDDYRNPARVVIGTRNAEPCPRLEALYRDYDGPVFVVRTQEAEMIKLIDNSWHAAKVVFANEMGRVCDALGISADTMHKLFVADDTLNTGPAYLRPGGPFGGSCLPKDVRALQHIGAQASTHLVNALIASNDAHKQRQFELASKGLRKAAKLLLVGLAFKPGTDDLRESPQVDLAARLIEAGFEVDIFDPHVIPSRLLGQNLSEAEAKLPGFQKMMVGKNEAENKTYARILACNELIEELDVDSSKTVSLCTFP